MNFFCWSPFLFAPELNAKGAPVKSCEGVPVSGPVLGNVEDLFGLQPKNLNCSYQEFDAYGQTIAAYTPSSHPGAVNSYVVDTDDNNTGRSM